MTTPQITLNRALAPVLDYLCLCRNYSGEKFPLRVIIWPGFLQMSGILESSAFAGEMSD